MSSLADKLVDAATWIVLITLILWLTLFALFGSVISILLILCLIVSFAAAKEPPKKEFLAACVITFLFFLFPFEASISRGDQLAIKIQRISYGLPTLETIKRANRGEIVLGGCMVTPFDRHWNVSLILPYETR